jgi:general transcription factor IIIA
MKAKARSMSVVSEFSEGSEVESISDPETPITEPQTPLVSGRKSLPCLYQGCRKSFNRQARLTEHIRSHTNERPFSCSEKNCDKAFLRDSHLKHHIKSAHTNERNYPCTWATCGKKFATGTRLRRHESSHQTKEKYTCKGFDGCSESFRKHATLSRHILSVHENKKPFPCTESNIESGESCTLGFDTAEKLRSHRRAVHDHTRFACLDCLPLDDELGTRVSFSTYALLKIHIAEVHPPTCSHCSLLCTTDKDLRRHLDLTHNVSDSEAENSKTHTFPCTYLNCSRSFTKKGNLNVHVKTVHEHRKDFVCGQTELKLPQEATPKTESEPVENPEITGCGRHFTSKATLEEHVRTVHMGMNSKRQERNRKRREERAAEDEYVGAESGGTGIRKKRRRAPAAKSTISELTGSANLAIAAEYEAGTGLSNPFDELLYSPNFVAGFEQEFKEQPFPQQGFDHLSSENASAKGYDLEPSLGVDWDQLAASALVDPVLLSG